MGIFTNRRFSILVKNINYLDIRQSLITKLFRVYLVFISCTGYGKGGGRVSALIPAGTQKSVYQTLDMLLPEIKPRARALRPNAGALIRYIISPMWACILVPAGGFILSFILPEWSEAIKILTVMAMLPSVWCLILKIVDFITAGITCDNETITLRYSRWFVLHTVVVPREKISMIHLRQSCFQVKDGHCDVLVYTYSEGKIPWRNMHRVKNVRIDYAREILNLTDEAVFADEAAVRKDAEI